MIAYRVAQQDYFASYLNDLGLRQNLTFPGTIRRLICPAVVKLSTTMYRRETEPHRGKRSGNDKYPGGETVAVRDHRRTSDKTILSPAHSDAQGPTR